MLPSLPPLTLARIVLASQDDAPSSSGASWASTLFLQLGWEFPHREIRERRTMGFEDARLGEAGPVDGKRTGVPESRAVGSRRALGLRERICSVHPIQIKAQAAPRPRHPPSPLLLTAFAKPLTPDGSDRTPIGESVATLFVFSALALDVRHSGVVRFVNPFSRDVP
ncbi:hypothetical protein MVEN_00862600 [Mycena venus]|uniref:Uncharacterized protein n=1 Tax=Mycena venus TaxID=2733690 RepID=A0A8H6YHM6_9AGAR|nr:hypothetical protein MVEN_00862600 [Mycena venus]